MLAEHQVDAVPHSPLTPWFPNRYVIRQVLWQQHPQHAQPAGRCAEAGVRQFLFSSTAAVYGMPASGVADEDTPTQPIIRRHAKLMSGTSCAISARPAMRHVILRY